MLCESLAKIAPKLQVKESIASCIAGVLVSWPWSLGEQKFVLKPCLCSG